MRYLLTGHDVTRFCVGRPIFFTLGLAVIWWLTKDEGDGWMRVIAAGAGFWFASLWLGSSIARRKVNDENEESKKYEGSDEGR